MSRQYDEVINLRMESADRAALERISQAQHRPLANLARCVIKDFIEASTAAEAKAGRAS